MSAKDLDIDKLSALNMRVHCHSSVQLSHWEMGTARKHQEQWDRWTHLVTFRMRSCGPISFKIQLLLVWV